MLGYDLCFTVLLVKLWRIYYIFHNPTPSKKVCVSSYIDRFIHGCFLFHLYLHNIDLPIFFSIISFLVNQLCNKRYWPLGNTFMKSVFSVTWTKHYTLLTIHPLCVWLFVCFSLAFLFSICLSFPLFLYSPIAYVNLKSGMFWFVMLQAISDTHLLVGALFLIIPDLLIYMVLVPLESTVADVGIERNKEEPFALNVGKASIETPSSL